MVSRIPEAMHSEPSHSSAPVRWEDDPLDWTRAAGGADRLLAALEVRKRAQRRRRAVGIVGAAAAVAIAGVFWAAGRGHVETVASGIVRIPSGRATVTTPERRTLPDGSVVELKPGARISVAFDATDSGPRRVELRRGEAHFAVAPDARRPFVVMAGGVRFRALGTAFSVDLEEVSVGMLVTEGRVAVEAAAEAAGDPGTSSPLATVERGERVVVPVATSDAAPSSLTASVAPAAMPPSVVKVTDSEAGALLAWRVPRLEFNETPLWEVVTLINRESGSRICLANPELGRVEISGALRADNIDPLLQNLQDNYRIAVVRRPTGEIELGAARSAAGN